MLSAVERGTGALPPKGRLLFADSSQPTPSQYLNKAMHNCRLGSQSSSAVDDADPLCSQPRISVTVSCSQDFVPGSQDFITPRDQQCLTAQDSVKAGHHFRTPAPISPNRIKRPRNVLGDADPMDCSQLSQGSQCLPVDAPGVSGSEAADEFQAPRKMVRTRMPSPPCARNVFVDGLEDKSDVSSILKRPPFVSRYRAEFQEMAILGQGNFSKVFRVKNKFDGMEYAVKRSFRAVVSDAEAKRWQQEAMAMAAAGTHQNIVRYYSSWTEQHSGEQLFYILMEKCEESLSAKQTLAGHHFKEPELIDILRQVAEALQHLHSRGIIHMDVKPDNIYTTQEGTYKLGDFGLATCRSISSDVEVDEGDARYIPQEVLNDDCSALDKADVFMLGASLYELASGTQLPTGGSTYHEIRQGKLMLMPSFSTSFQKMLKWLMSPSPAERPTPSKVLASSLLARRGQGTGSKENYGALPFAPVVTQ